MLFEEASKKQKYARRVHAHDQAHDSHATSRNGQALFEFDSKYGAQLPGPLGENCFIASVVQVEGYAKCWSLRRAFKTNYIRIRSAIILGDGC